MPTSSRRARSIVLPVSVLVCAGLLLFGTATSILRAQQPGQLPASLPQAKPVQEATGFQAAIAIEQAMIQAIADCEKSVVSIARVGPSGEDTQRDMRVDIFPKFGQPRLGGMINDPPQPTDPDFVPNEFATGVVIDASGLILTNAHVLDEKSDHYVTTSSRKVFQTKIKASDPRSDLAVLQVVEKDNNGDDVPIKSGDFVPIKFGDSKTLKKGQIVIALGNPYSIARDGQVSASWGIVSNLSRKVAPRSAGEKTMLMNFGTLIQTDAKLNLGTSGGALVNLKGEMIGLTTSLAATAGYEQAAGYAIPVDETFRRVLEKLKKGTGVEYGFLGILPANLAYKEILRGGQGIRVDQVSPGTPARRAGLLQGDIITHVNGEPIYDADGLRLQVGKLPASATATLTMERNGQTLVEQVHLSKIGRLHGKGIATNQEPAWRGLRVDFPSVVFPQGVDDSVGQAVVVTEVAAASPAEKAGLRLGLLITHVGNTSVETPEDFRRELANLNGPISLRIADVPGERTIVVEPK
jgi:serine protease Do